MLIKKLDWDSEYFGFNIADLNLDEKDRDLASLDKFIAENNIDFIQSCCDISNVRQINLLEENGFRFADLKITYFLDLEKEQTEKDEIVFSNENDIEDLKRIADNIFIDSRYYHEMFDKEKIDNFYKVWVEKAVRGTFDDVCIKAMEKGKIAGFITGKLLDGDISRVGLIGVDENYQNKGIGGKLMKSFLNYSIENKKRFVEISTQGKNIKANNFYIKNNFRIKKIGGWFYKSLSRTT